MLLLTSTAVTVAKKPAEDVCCSLRVLPQTVVTEDGGTLRNDDISVLILVLNAGVQSEDVPENFSTILTSGTFDCSKDIATFMSF